MVVEAAAETKSVAHEKGSGAQHLALFLFGTVSDGGENGISLAVYST